MEVSLYDLTILMPSFSERPHFRTETTELMSVIFLLIAASTLVAAVFLAAFIRAVRSGQYDDDRSPAVRMLHDPTPRSNQPPPPPPKERDNPSDR
jgi:cbb3-type cytochrome oxidase maturation protein